MTHRPHPLLLRVRGMTCASCELLLERKIRTLPGVRSVDIDHRKGTARVTAEDGAVLDEDRIAEVIRDAGYGLAGEDPASPSMLAPEQRKWMEIAGCALVILTLGKLLQAAGLQAPSAAGALSAGGIVLIGLVAGTSSCLAVTGGLLLALAAKHHELSGARTPWEKFRPLLQFNAGRLAAYFVLGGCVGLLGRSITLSVRMTGVVGVFTSLVMLYLALTMLHIVPRGAFPLRPPKSLSRRIASLSESGHPAAPALLGALTFFLPCGFTQSLQVAALGTGNFFGGAAVMFLFALGTLPSLLGLSAVSSAARGRFSALFLRFAGTLVLMLSLFNLRGGLSLAGVATDAAPRVAGGAAIMRDGVQEVSMRVTPYGTYEPKVLTVRAGLPVRWNVDGTDAAGCTDILTVPSLNISRRLLPGKNVIEFTPKQRGTLAFMCSMGMVRGSFRVI